MVVPQGQDVIPRRPRGGASCKGVISRRPRGDASLLGLNSTVLWWCLIMRIQIVRSCSFEGLVCHVWLLSIYAWLYDWMMIIMMYEFCAPAYPFACLYGCVCGFPPLQWSSTLLMWEDVRTRGSGNGNGDATAWWLRTGMGLTIRPSAEEVLLSRFIFLYKNLCCCWYILIRLGSVVPPLFCYEHGWGIVYLLIQFPHFWYLYMCDALLNWIYLFNWGVTYYNSIYFGEIHN